MAQNCNSNIALWMSDLLKVISHATIRQIMDHQTSNIEQAISQGAQALGMDVAETAVASLAAYVGLLERWNRVYNLSAVRSPQEMVIRHILDSLSILPWVTGPKVLDVGSGAGLPGIPLAVMRPDWEFYLLDANGKRTRFIQQASADLELNNVKVLRCRIEDYQSAQGFDSILSRAFASLSAMLSVAGRLCAPSGRLLAMKGALSEQELAELPSGYRLARVYPLNVPGLNAQRHLVHLSPDSVFHPSETPCLSIQGDVECPRSSQ